MASSSDPALNEELQCSICLEVFTDPVTTPCGHNFCRTCLSKCWTDTQTCFCPLCKETFSRRPDLKINTTLGKLVQHFKKLNQESEVFCDFCGEIKQKAVKSCLTCQSSYCDSHLEPHLSVSCLKKHKLINAVENLEDYICQKHERPLELFCRDDQTCVCLFCTEGEHKIHNTVPIEEERREKKTLASNDCFLTSSQTVHISNGMIIGLGILMVAALVILPKQYTLWHSINKELEQQFTELERRNTELEQEITELNRRNTVPKQEITELEKRNTELKRRNTELEQEITELEKRNTELKRRNTELEQEITELEKRNTELKRRNTELEQEITELEKRNTELEQEITELEKRNTELKQEITELERRNTELKRRNTELKQEITELKRRNTELEQEITELERRNTELEQEITELERRNTELEQEITELERRNTELEQEITELKQEITELKQDITELKRRNTELKRRNTELEQEITELKRRNTELKRRNTAIEQEITELKRRNTELKQEITELKRRNTELKQEITELKRRNTELEQEITELERRNTELEQEITELERRNTELEQEITELERRNTELEQLSYTDHLHLMQMYSSLYSLSHTKDWIEIDSDSDVDAFTLKRALTLLKEQLNEKLTLTVLKWAQKYAVDVTLDPDTANPYLILSDDGKQVSHGDIEQDVPENPKRFDESLCVLAKEGFSSGRFYYEVQVKGQTEWDLGVIRESIKRKGTILLSPKNGVWAVVLWSENKYFVFDDPPVSLSLRVKPEMVGVFVDYEEGLVSFYDMESRSHIYSFTGQTFTDKLYPYFCPGYNDEGENPLIISPIS